MGQDLREMLRDSSKELNPSELSSDHELRFLDKLENAFLDVSSPEIVGPKESLLTIKTNHSYKKWFSIAASTVVSVGLGWYLVQQTETLQQTKNTIVHVEKQNNSSRSSIADVSPEFKRFEEISLASINVGLSELKINDTNRSVVKSYIKQLEHLKKEYRLIQLDFQLGQVSPQAIEVLIENLQMQLSLLEQLKQKVKNINEYSSSTAYENLQT